MRRPAGLSPLDSSEPGRKKMWVLPLVLIVVVILIAGGFFFFKGKQFSSEEEVTAALGGEKNVEVSPIASGAYQAVFLDNGQVYFGKLTRRKGDFYRLEGVYYLQFRQNLQNGDLSQTEESDLSLIKLGNEVHGPEDFMDMNKDHILFIEDLKSDSKIAKAIADHLSKKNK